MERFIQQYDQYRAWLVLQQQTANMSVQAVEEYLRQWKVDWLRSSGGTPSGRNNSKG